MVILRNAATNYALSYCLSLQFRKMAERNGNPFHILNY